MSPAGLRLAAWDPRWAPELAARHPAAASLGCDLADEAHGRGTQAVVALEGDRPMGVAGWVGLGVASTGILYGAPVLADSLPAALALLEYLIARGEDLGATRLRVTCRPEEPAKAGAMARLGFLPLFDMIDVECPVEGLPAAGRPGDLAELPPEGLDWARMALAYNRVFRDVPNAPPVDAQVARDEWRAADPEASRVWADGEGEPVAWLLARPDGYVCEVGVCPSRRGQGLASALYAACARVLAARGVRTLRATLADTNLPTWRFHERLGFREVARRSVGELDLSALRAAGPARAPGPGRG